MTDEEFKAAVVAKGYSEEGALGWLKVYKMDIEPGVEPPKTMEEFVNGVPRRYVYSAYPED